jgi:hypothetical protein
MTIQYSAATPVETLLDGTIDFNVTKSLYANLRWNTVPERIITIDSKYEANLPGLAFDYYGDMEMWRAILAFNGLFDAVQDVQVGVQIGLPSRQSIDEYFAAQSKSSNLEISV